MLKILKSFSSFSVDDLEKARKFYEEVLMLDVKENGNMGLSINVEGGTQVFIYGKENHQPATFTVLNFVVGNIEEAVGELKKRGVEFEKYDEGMIKTDEKGIARGRAENNGPDIAWFKDPSGNILSVLEE